MKLLDTEIKILWQMPVSFFPKEGDVSQHRKEKGIQISLMGKIKIARDKTFSFVSILFFPIARYKSTQDADGFSALYTHSLDFIQNTVQTPPPCEES